MYFFILLISCKVTLCCCQELQNQNVEPPDRAKRTAAKSDEYMQTLLKDHNKINIVVAPKTKAPHHLNLQPKERHVLSQIAKDLQKTQPITYRDIPAIHPFRQLLESQTNDVTTKKDIKRIQTQSKKDPKSNYVKIERPRRPSGHNRDKVLHVPKKVHEKNHLKPSVEANKTTNFKEKTSPNLTSFMEVIHVPSSDPPVQDIKVTTKPQVTTPNQKVDSQVEKPESVHLDKHQILSEDDKVKKHSHLDDFSPKSATTHVTSKSSDDTSPVDVKLNYHRIEESNNKIQNDPSSSQDSSEIHNQLELPDIHAVKSNIMEMEEMMRAKRKKTDSHVPIKHEEEDHSDVSTIIETPISTRKAMRIPPSVPLTTSTSDELVGKMKNSSDDAFLITKPVVDSLANKTIEAIEIKHRNYAEVVEKQPSIIESNKPSDWQECGTQTQESNQQASYVPNVPVVPPYYAYPANQNNFNEFYDNRNNNLQRNEDPTQRRWRSWVNTEVVIKMKNPPITQMQPFSTSPITQQYPTKYNNVQKYITPRYRSYPYYVYPSVCYGANNGFYQ